MTMLTKVGLIVLNVRGAEEYITVQAGILRIIRMADMSI